MNFTFDQTLNKKGISLMLFCLLSIACLSQKKYVLSFAESKMTISGTSTLHDWESKVEDVSGQGIFIISEGQVKGIQQLEITVKVNSIKSGKSLMDSKTYEALKEKDHPSIKLVLKEAKSVKQTDNQIELQILSQLTIAGVTKEVTTSSNISILPNGQLVSKGVRKMKMSTFNIDPPTAMMGTIKCGDEVTVTYELKFKPV